MTCANRTAAGTYLRCSILVRPQYCINSSESTPSEHTTDTSSFPRAAPTTAAISSQLLTRFGSTEEYAWVIPVFTVTSCITSLLTNGLSDLFGRRMFLIAANVIVAAGYALSAAAKNTQMLLGGITLVGIGYGVSGIALFAVPELVPNKYRHIGVVLADLFVYVIIVIGPVAGRYAILSSGESWRFLYWGGFIGSVLCFFGLLFFYCTCPLPNKRLCESTADAQSPPNTPAASSGGMRCVVSTTWAPFCLRPGEHSLWVSNRGRAPRRRENG